MSRESRVQERGVSSESASRSESGNGVAVPGRVPSAGVPAKPQRRQFSADFKTRIVEEADACTQAGEVTALLRRQYRSGAAAGLAQRRGPKGKDPVVVEKEALERKVARLQQRSMSAVTELAVTVDAQAACGALAIPRASYYRRRKPYRTPPRPVPVRVPSPRALSAPERQVVLDTLHTERFQDRSPGHVVAALLSEATWLCSERTMYRILAAYGETQERRRQRQHPVYVKPQLRAVAPNQVWTRDYTKVRGPARGIWFLGPWRVVPAPRWPIIFCERRWTSTRWRQAP